MVVIRGTSQGVYRPLSGIGVMATPLESDACCCEEECRTWLACKNVNTRLPGVIQLEVDAGGTGTGSGSGPGPDFYPYNGTFTLVSPYLTSIYGYTDETGSAIQEITSYGAAYTTIQNFRSCGVYLAVDSSLNLLMYHLTGYGSGTGLGGSGCYEYTLTEFPKMLRVGTGGGIPFYYPLWWVTFDVDPIGALTISGGTTPFTSSQDGASYLGDQPFSDGYAVDAGFPLLHFLQYFPPGTVDAEGNLTTNTFVCEVGNQAFGPNPGFCSVPSHVVVTIPDLSVQKLVCQPQPPLIPKNVCTYIDYDELALYLTLSEFSDPLVICLHKETPFSWAGAGIHLCDNNEQSTLFVILSCSGADYSLTITDGANTWYQTVTADTPFTYFEVPTTDLSGLCGVEGLSGTGRIDVCSGTSNTLTCGPEEWSCCPPTFLYFDVTISDPQFAPVSISNSNLLFDGSGYFATILISQLCDPDHPYYYTYGVRIYCDGTDWKLDFWITSEPDQVTTVTATSVDTNPLELNFELAYSPCDANAYTLYLVVTE